MRSLPVPSAIWECVERVVKAARFFTVQDTAKLNDIKTRVVRGKILISRVVIITVITVLDEQFSRDSAITRHQNVGSERGAQWRSLCAIRAAGKCLGVSIHSMNVRRVISALYVDN